MLIEGLSVQKSSIRYKNVEFYEYQGRFLKSLEKFLFLQTPTGSGKTLALLSKVLLGTTSSGTLSVKNGIFLYPTNELIKDQMYNLEKAAHDLGFHTRVLDISHYLQLEEDDNWRRQMLHDLIQDIHQHTETVVFIAMNGQELGGLVELESKSMPKGKLIFDVLNQISNANIPCIICTNIDTLYLVIQQKYHRASQILNTLLNWRHIAVDEFHLYSGVDLANLIYCLMLYYTFVYKNIYRDYWFAFSSATPSPVYDIFMTSFPDDCKIISTELFSTPKDDANTFHQIRHETELICHSVNWILYKAEDLEVLSDLIIKIMLDHQFSTIHEKNVALLVLVNSVAFCESLFKKICNRILSEPTLQDVPIHRIHSFISKQDRPVINKLSNALLIGTRSIELGIDFDVPILIFEAHDRGTFFQRLGRGGRHGPCIIHAFVPRLTIQNIEHEVTNGHISFENLEHAVQFGLREETIFEDFIFSEQGIKLLAILIYSLQPDKPGIEFDLEAINNREKIYNRLRSLFRASNKEFPPPSDFTCSLIPKVRADLCNNAFARGSTIHFPALVQLYISTPTWHLLSIFDLIKCDFKIKPFDKINRELQKIVPKKWKIRNSELIPIISNIIRERNLFPELLHTSGTGMGYRRYGYVFYTNIGNTELLFRSNLDDDFNEKINRLLKQRILPFTHVPEKYDWRVPSIKELNYPTKRIVIGESAFLASYIYDTFYRNSSN